jgi:hypothetical protein
VVGAAERRGPEHGNPLGQSAADVPVAADYDGDGRFDVAIYNPSTREMVIRRSTDGTGQVVSMSRSSQPGDVPVLRRMP